MTCNSSPRWSQESLTEPEDWKYIKSSIWHLHTIPMASLHHPYSTFLWTHHPYGTSTPSLWYLPPHHPYGTFLHTIPMVPSSTPSLWYLSPHHSYGTSTSSLVPPHHPYMYVPVRKDNLAVMGEENFHSFPIAFLCEGDRLCEV